MQAVHIDTHSSIALLISSPEDCWNMAGTSKELSIAINIYQDN
jgi:hypothetical protein